MKKTGVIYLALVFTLIILSTTISLAQSNPPEDDSSTPPQEEVKPVFEQTEPNQEDQGDPINPNPTTPPTPTDDYEAESVFTDSTQIDDQEQSAKIDSEEIRSLQRKLANITREIIGEPTEKADDALEKQMVFPDPFKKSFRVLFGIKENEALPRYLFILLVSTWLIFFLMIRDIFYLFSFYSDSTSTVISFLTTVILGTLGVFKGLSTSLYSISTLFGLLQGWTAGIFGVALILLFAILFLVSKYIKRPLREAKEEDEIEDAANATARTNLLTRIITKPFRSVAEGASGFKEGRRRKREAKRRRSVMGTTPVYERESSGPEPIRIEKESLDQKRPEHIIDVEKKYPMSDEDKQRVKEKLDREEKW
jgi:hypothetical protein